MAKTKEVKRAEAAERQARYDARKTLDKVLIAASRRGHSVRETDRLLASA